MKNDYTWDKRTSNLTCERVIIWANQFDIKKTLLCQHMPLILWFQIRKTLTQTPSWASTHPRITGTYLLQYTSILHVSFKSKIEFDYCLKFQIDSCDIVYIACVMSVALWLNWFFFELGHKMIPHSSRVTTSSSYCKLIVSFLKILSFYWFVITV